MYLRVLGSDESRNVLIQVLQYERNTVGKHEVLTHILKLEGKATKTTFNAGITSSGNTNDLYEETSSSAATQNKL